MLVALSFQVTAAGREEEEEKSSVLSSATILWQFTRERWGFAAAAVGSYLPLRHH